MKRSDTSPERNAADGPDTLAATVTRMAGRIADYYLSMAWHASRRHVKQAFSRMAEHVQREGEAAAHRYGDAVEGREMRDAFVRLGGRGPFSNELSALTGLFRGDFGDDEDVIHHAVRFNQDCRTFLGEWRRNAVTAEAITGLVEWTGIHEAHLERLNAILDLSNAVRERGGVPGGALERAGDVGPGVETQAPPSFDVTVDTVVLEVLNAAPKGARLERAS
jgi:hypothetical protein